MDNAYYLENMSECVDFVQTQTWPISNELKDFADNTPRLYLVSGIMTPALDSCIRAFTETIAQQRVLLAGIGLARYKHANGKLPDKLEDLVPTYLDQVPTDPFTGQALKYRLEYDGSILYSVGSDEQDNGGDSGSTMWQRDAGNNGTDITMVFGSIGERLWPDEAIIDSDEMSVPGEDATVIEGNTWYRDDLSVDEGHLAYLQQLKTNGFPQLVPRNTKNP